MDGFLISSETPMEVDTHQRYYGNTDARNNLLDQLKLMNKKFRHACIQVVLLNNEIEYMQNRYDIAVRDRRRSYRYFLRMKIATMEGVRNMIYEYACRRANQLDALHERLLREGIIAEELNLSDLEDDDMNDESFDEDDDEGLFDEENDSNESQQ